MALQRTFSFLQKPPNTQKSKYFLSLPFTEIACKVKEKWEKMNIIASHISPQSSRINLLNVTNRVINYLYEPVTLPCWIHQFLLEHSARVGDHLGTPGATNKASDFYAGCIVQMSVLSNTINTSRNQKTVALPSTRPGHPALGREA